MQYHTKQMKDFCFVILKKLYLLFKQHVILQRYKHLQIEVQVHQIIWKSHHSKHLGIFSHKLRDAMKKICNYLLKYIDERKTFEKETTLDIGLLIPYKICIKYFCIYANKKNIWKFTLKLSLLLLYLHLDYLTVLLSTVRIQRVKLCVIHNTDNENIVTQENKLSILITSFAKR